MEKTTALLDLDALSADRYAGTVDRIRKPTRASFYERYVLPSRPVIIQDALEGWAALDRWNAAWLRDRFGKEVVQIHVRDPETHVYSSLRSISFDAFIDVAAKVPPQAKYHLQSAHVFKRGASDAGSSQFRALLDDVVLPDYVAPEEIHDVYMLLNHDGMITNLHFDLHDNLLGVISGRKEVLLFDPREAVNLYPGSPFPPSPGPLTSQAEDIARADPNQFPRLKKAKYWKASIERGEQLYIPPHWWHYVLSQDFCIGLNVWFDRRQFLRTAIRSPYLSLLVSLWHAQASASQMRASASQMFSRK